MFQPKIYNPRPFFIEIKASENKSAESKSVKVIKDKSRSNEKGEVLDEWLIDG